MYDMSSYEANHCICTIGELENHPYVLTKRYMFVGDYIDSAKNALDILRKYNAISQEKCDEYKQKADKIAEDNMMFKSVKTYLTNQKRKIYKEFTA